MELQQIAKKRFGEIMAHYTDKGEYRCEASANSIELWHSAFDESEMCFIIDAEIFDEDKVCFCAYLYPHDRERKGECVAALEQVLGVGKDTFDGDSLEDNELYITLKDYEELDIVDFSLEAFERYFAKVKEKVYDFNDKICQDLELTDSKLGEFVS